MNKAKKAIKAIFEILKRPYLLNTIIEDEHFKKAQFEKEFPHITHFKEIPFEYFLQKEELTIQPFAFLGGSSLATDLGLLQLLCTQNSVENYLEIGTWRGESIANVAPYISKGYTLNLSDEELLELGLESDYIKMHRFFSKSIQNVTHLFGHSQKYDFESLRTKFDLIFIDGDHHTEAVFNDTLRLFDFRQSDESILVWHDAKSDPETPRYEVLLGIYRGIPSHLHENIYLVGNSLCAIYLTHKPKWEKAKTNKAPKQYFEVKIKQKNVEY